jgi:hypothetical protein
LPIASEIWNNPIGEVVPYISFFPKDGRAISLFPYFDEITKDFRLPVINNPNTTFVFTEPVQSIYFAKELMNENDLHVNLIEFITTLWSFPTTMDILAGIERDIVNCSSVVEKYFILLDHYRSTNDNNIANLILTDIEFLFGNIRSLYDSIEVLIADLMKKAHKKYNLPNSFNDIAKLDDTQIVKKFQIERPLLNFYSTTREFFSACRTIRDGFQHSRIDIPIIFCFEDGFALSKDSVYLKDPIVSQFKIWPDEKTKENGLVSVLGLMAYLNGTVLNHLDMLTEALKAMLPSQEPITKDYKVFFRAPHNNHLRRSREYQDGQWILPEKKIIIH